MVAFLIKKLVWISQFFGDNRGVDEGTEWSVEKDDDEAESVVYACVLIHGQVVPRKCHSLCIIALQQSNSGSRSS